MPLAPVTTDIVDADLEDGQSAEESSEETEESSGENEGPTMEDAIAAHNSSLPGIEGVENINVQVGDNFDPLAGVYAVDTQDGDITDQLEVTSDNVDTSSAGTYTVNYRVENSSNSYYEHTRQITVSDAPSDPIAPVPETSGDTGDSDEENDSGNEGESSNSGVVFRGIEDVTISAGSHFDPQEDVTILDADGINITHEMYLSGDVDTSTPGEYTIAYAVFDLFDNPHAEARTVTVE